MATCPKCGFDLTRTQMQSCPQCSAAILSTVERTNPWLRALVLGALSSVIMLLLGFSSPEIVLLGVFIFCWNVYLRSAKAKQDATRPDPQQLRRPALYVALNLLIVVGIMTFCGTLLFGSFSFRNSWDRWHKYEAHPFHRTDFEVTQVYFEKTPLRPGDAGAGIVYRGGISYAFGLVEGSRESMYAADYLHHNPHNQAELDRRIPLGTRIPIYFFPDMKGRDRVQVYDGLPPAEASCRMARKDLTYGLLILTGAGATVFVLIRLRQTLCC